ncbi:MAG: DegT/DnrJ/EryC1/StrS family aminotransferase [Firmicutes bacterium]|nr:DegT/DnrJ/EryC1/StrS family aminotransferase [Bacillota bacterium]
MGRPKDASGLRQEDAPFLAALAAYADEGPVPFHTPGHKQGRGAPNGWRERIGLGALSLDVSDVLTSPRFDDSWPAARAAAEGLAARAFGADYCFFLANGTTSGVHAMLLAAVPGRQVIVARNSHRSVAGGLILAGARPVFVEPEFDPASGIPLPPRLDAWRKAMDENPDAAAVLVTYPTYEGVAFDLASLARDAQSRGMAVLVDEAHGAHLGLHPALPPPALACGADISAQSPHKLLGALTQGSWLLGRDNAVPHQAVETVLALLETTSPSALILASLDAARRQAAIEGKALLDKALAIASEVREAVAGIEGLACWRPDRSGLRLDETKVVISVADLGMSGFTAARRLRALGVQVEMGGAGHVLALITLGDDRSTAGALVDALRRLSAETRQGGPGIVSRGRPRAGGSQRQPAWPPPGAQRLSPRDAALGRGRITPLDQAAGHVAADVVCPYPPGVPVLWPGEEVSEEAVEYLQDILSRGGEVRGLRNQAGRPALRVADPG